MMPEKDTVANEAVKGTRDIILEAGHKAITAKSYHACGLKEILDLAGVPKGSFYHYFKSKDDFGLQLIENSTDGWNQECRAKLTDRTYTPLNRLKNYFSDKITYFLEHGLSCECALPKMALETSQLNEVMRGAIKYSFDSMASVLAQTIREAQVADEINCKDDADMLANMINSALQGIIIRVQIDQSIVPLEQFVALIFNNILQEKSSS
ncbi:TetR/AcrR family transcriptional regulator [Thalassomonas haliotis]|uniref:TetR/AcrR family transcriptional regulator n=1 Tax=Thalassomonas haliotis TaxID=485448 RepID=A0ABY7VCT2_9GAMM|nr:TetR/AcrR family transcriptional regulator [Thalassomonas haliotis]WDE11353.1 TetR/AcrR family transcriptional regulator [Thalassomonas haliotis]